MKRLSIAAILEQIVVFLRERGPYLIAAELLDDYIKTALSLLEKARSPGEVLYVGILGGTGVGKSTLIDALARKEISSPSDRRPYTDRAVVYRHKDTSLGLDDIAHLVSDPDAVHDSEAIRELILLDMPDFDSFRLNHRRTVGDILPKLDCIVWVVSPEKYADDVFYRVVGDTAINRSNFTFVLNKADQLVPAGGGDPNTGFKEVLGDFTFRLKNEAGLEDPRIFMLSAEQEFRGKNDNSFLASEFQRFRDFLMVRRDAKEIRSVKTINLVEETRRLLLDLHMRVRPEEKKRVLDTVRDIKSTASHQTIRPNLELLEQEERLSNSLSRLLVSEDGSIAPVGLCMRLLARLRSIARSGDREQLEEVFHTIGETLGKHRTRELENITSRMDSQLMLAFPLSEKVRPQDAVHRTVVTALSRASDAFSHNVALHKQSVARQFAMFRRLRQRLVLFLPLPLFVLKLAGFARAEAFLDQPSLKGALQLVVYCLAALFGAEGLTGLAVLLICEMLLVWYLAAKRIKKIEKYSSTLAKSAISYLDENLKSAERDAVAEKTNLVRKIEEGVDDLEALETAFASLAKAGAAQAPARTN